MRGALVPLGEVTGVYGVRGWVRVYSYTDPIAAILDYPVWQLGEGSARRSFPLEAGRTQGKRLIAKLVGVDDRDAAAALIGDTVSVPRSELPECAPGEYYWADLEGLEVLDLRGESLGHVSHLIETGAHDVMVLKGERERLIPFVPERVVRRVDLERGCIVVDWDPEY